MKEEEGREGGYLVSENVGTREAGGRILACRFFPLTFVNREAQQLNDNSPLLVKDHRSWFLSVEAVNLDKTKQK